MTTTDGDGDGAAERSAPSCYPPEAPTGGPTDAQIEAVAEAIRNDPAFDDFFTALASAALTAAAEVQPGTGDVSTTNRPSGVESPAQSAAAEVRTYVRSTTTHPDDEAAEVRPTLTQEAYAAGLEDGAIREREACARLADAVSTLPYVEEYTAKKIAAAIRARKDEG